MEGKTDDPVHPLGSWPWMVVPNDAKSRGDHPLIQRGIVFLAVLYRTSFSILLFSWFVSLILSAQYSSRLQIARMKVNVRGCMHDQPSLITGTVPQSRVRDRTTEKKEESNYFTISWNGIRPNGQSTGMTKTRLHFNPFWGKLWRLATGSSWLEAFWLRGSH